MKEMETVRDSLLLAAISLLEEGNLSTATYLGNLAAAIEERLLLEEKDCVIIPPAKGENGSLKFFC